MIFTRHATARRLLAMLAVLLAFPLPTLAFDAPAFILQWGSLGTFNGRFQYPHGIAFAPATNRVYVADTANHRVQWFNTSGLYQGKWGSNGLGPGQFSSTAGIAVDASGNVYVASDHRVQKFTSTGSYITGWGGQGSGDGQFQWAGGVAIDAAGNVYVTDWGNSRVQRFTSDGVFITKWGSAGSGAGQLGGTAWVTSGPDGRMYVSDSNNNRIQVFDTNGTYLFEFGSSGTPAGPMVFPCSPAIDAEFVYVPDTGNDRIVVFRLDGSYVLHWGTTGSSPSQFFRPTAIACEPGGTLYVDDKDNNRIQKFASVTTATSATTWGSVKQRYR